MYKKKKSKILCVFFILLLSTAFCAYGQQTYRLLILYTPAVSAALGAANVRNYVTAWGVEEANTIYYNSRNNGNDPAVYNVQLAGIDSVAYTESGDMGTDNDAVLNGAGTFANTTTLQARYAADVVLLVVNHAGYSGITTIQANPIYGSTYYCVSVAQYDYMPTRYTAVHEIGHIFGCQHAWWDLYHDAQWLYGHGWGDRPTGPYPYGTWGTVMCYNDGRQELFSNPNRGHNGVPAGQTDSAFNAKVYTQNIAGVNAFRSTSATVSVQNDTINSQEFGDIRATSSITIGNHFLVKQGGQLNLSQAAGLAKKSIGGEGGGKPQPQIKTPGKPSVTAFSIHAKGRSFVVTYSLAQSENVTFWLFNMNGQLVTQRNLGQRSAGCHTEKLTTSFLYGNQIYVIMMKAGNIAFRQVVRGGD